MGNQGSSGIVEETIAKNEVHEKSQRVTSDTDELKEEKQAQVDQGDFQENCEKDESVNEEFETQADVEETNESNLSKFKEEQDEISCDSRVLNSKHHEGDTDIISENQEGESVLEKEVVEIDYHEVEAKENVFFDAGTPCDEGVVLKTRADEAECGKNDDHEEEQSDSISTINDVKSISLKESSADENVDQNQHSHSFLESSAAEKVDQNQHIGLIESSAAENVDQNQHSDSFLESSAAEKVDQNQHIGLIESYAAEKVDQNQHMRLIDSSAAENIDQNQHISLIESSAAEKVDQNQLFDQEIRCCNDPSEMIKSEENGEECVVEIDSNCGLDKSDEKAVEEVKETGPIAVKNEQENEELVDESILEKECIKNESFESKKPIVELKKCPSFDFGVSFIKQMEESDQTPLLYQDKTARRSVSSCSNLRFQRVQAEYEALEVKEKTIRMERSNSESTNNVSSVNNMQETGLKASSSSKNDDSLVSERANVKRKPRSSLFTTCICCTAAIS